MPLMMLRNVTVGSLLLAAALALGTTSCETTDHESIDKWTRTEKGPGKLRKAMSDGSIDADLSAHAAVNLIKQGADKEVFTAVAELGDARRAVVLGKLVPRLWEMARIEGEMTQPNPNQVAGKDALFALRKSASPEVKTTIDGYLTDWYTSGHYEGRASVGKFVGSTVMRALGPTAGAKLMSAANAILAKPANGTTRPRIGDELLLGMAASGNPEAVQYIIEVSRMNRGDKTQGARALSALFKAYIDSGGLFDIVEPAPLVPNISKLVEIAIDSTVSPRMSNDAVELIRATGMPHCLPPFVAMIGQAHSDPQFRYVGANNALKCGGVKAIVDVVTALKDGETRTKDELAGAVWGEIAKISPHDQVLPVLRELITRKSAMARWVAAETLLVLKSKGDLDKVQSLTGDGTKLTGYWGRQDDVDAKARKPEPTLGQRAGEIAVALKALP
jgi:hypothetical protein